ncbi:hypothetical protein [Rhizobium sp. GCM10022189]|uniref:hypothetical protein n=1 Tax=Rhizobium sp. GCM10022189 TaxID=3252654 RepID=UPI00361DC885
MSRTAQHKNDTSKLFQSEGGLQDILEFIREHSMLLDRLSGVFDKAPAFVIDGRHVLAEPVYMTIDAKTVALSRKVPKQNLAEGTNHSVTLVLSTRHPGVHGTPAIVTAFAATAMRIRMALRVCDIIYSTGKNTADTLEALMPEYIAQMEATAHWLATDFLTR